VPSLVTNESANIQDVVGFLQGLANRQFTESSIGAEKKKKEMVEKSLAVLSQLAAQNALPPDVVGLIRHFAATAGSAEGKEVINKLTTDHWETFKTFKDIKYLQK